MLRVVANSKGMAMILVFNNDDFKLIDVAYGSSVPRGTPRPMGFPYCYLRGHDYKGLLDVREALYISAHGNNFEIGNEGSEDKKYNITAVALADMLLGQVLPEGYQGNIYLSCCDSHPTYDAAVKVALAKRHIDYSGTIYGVEGQVAHTVQPHGWGGYRTAK